MDSILKFFELIEIEELATINLSIAIINQKDVYVYSYEYSKN